MNRREFTSSAAAIALLAASPAPTGAEAVRPDFRFRSDFWQNLHHTLYYQAQVLETVYGAGSERLNGFDQAAYRDLLAAAQHDAADWYRAIRIYHDQYASLSFVFDGSLVNADNAISGTPAAPLAHEIPAPMREALTTAAPAYEATLWKAHDASNRAFIATLSAAVDRHESVFAARLAQIYRTPWLAQPYAVDVVQYAQWEGSYSNNAAGFVHIVMSARDSSESGIAGLDVLFHEASHSIADPSTGTIGGAITAASRSLNRPAPDQFWHALIMYTPGRIAEETAAASGVKYTMIWMQPGLLGRRWWRYLAALDAHWRPYMRGSGTPEAAITRCVEKIVADPWAQG